MTRSAARGSTTGLGSFAQSYGTTELDASPLLMPLVGFLPPDDPRIAGTVEAIERRLCVDGFVLRYNTPTLKMACRPARARSSPAASGSPMPMSCSDASTKPEACSTGCSAVQRRGPARRGIRHRGPASGRQLSSGVLPHRAGQHRAQYCPCHEAVRAAFRERAARGGGGIKRCCTVSDGSQAHDPQEPDIHRCAASSTVSAAAARQVPASTSKDETASLPRNLSVVVVMGVAGCGKSTVRRCSRTG